MEGNAKPGSGSGDQRTLASIMFTDVVGFSKHSAIDEERTVRALNRDFDLIYKAVAAHNGQVLNTMGDGMMVVFQSAIECVRCAIDIQHALYELKHSQPPDGVLQHRIGLHIGDVVLNGKNTMGDGINQASRIESLARPDSIAMSKDLHDFVRGKTPFNAKYLGPLRAKNIPEAIPIFEIAPIDDEIRQRQAEALFTPPSAETNQGATGRRGALILVASIFLIALAASPIFLLKAAQKSANDQANKEGRGILPGKATKEELENIGKKLKNEHDANNTPVVDANNVPPANNTPTNTISLTSEQIADIASKTNTYDYAGVVAIIKQAHGADSEDGKSMIKKFEDLDAFQKWLSSEVAMATEATPIEATIDNSQVKVYSTKDGTVIDQAGTLSTARLWEFKATTILEIANAVALKTPSAVAAPTEVAGWITTFKEVHRLS
jgi:class 3 adenylate cyclase